jgi:DNA protecting protein DprA
LKDELFAVVGSRRTTDGARKLGTKIAKELTARFSVVTGSADGGDEAALQGGLDGGKAVCLLAGGFGFAPKENPLLGRVAAEGLLLSACPHDTPIRVFSYEYRNKLLAALSSGVLVLGAAEKSGALITAKYASAFGKKLFAIPYAPSVAAGVGCNRLIKGGAYLTETANDIFEKYGFKGTEKKKIPLTETEEKTVEFLTERGGAHIGEISSALSIPTYRLATVLSSLEIKGAVVKLGGNRYSVV